MCGFFPYNFSKEIINCHFLIKYKFISIRKKGRVHNKDTTRKLKKMKIKYKEEIN